MDEGRRGKGKAGGGGGMEMGEAGRLRRQIPGKPVNIHPRLLELPLLLLGTPTPFLDLGDLHKEGYLQASAICRFAYANAGVAWGLVPGEDGAAGTGLDSTHPSTAGGFSPSSPAGVRES